MSFSQFPRMLLRLFRHMLDFQNILEGVLMDSLSDNFGFRISFTVVYHRLRDSFTSSNGKQSEKLDEAQTNVISDEIDGRKTFFHLSLSIFVVRTVVEMNKSIPFFSK